MYKNFNDYEILYMISENNDFDILYKKYQPLIYKVVKGYIYLFKNYGYELDDLMQLGYITLYKTSYLYNNYDSSIFYTYFLSALKKSLFNEIRVNETYKKKILNESISYDNCLPGTNNRFIDIIPSKELNDYDEEKKKLTYFKNTLTFTSSCVFEMLYNGFSLVEIALLLDEDKKNIDNCLKEIRSQKKIQNY